MFGKTKVRSELTGKTAALGMNEAAGLRISPFLKNLWLGGALLKDEYNALLRELDGHYKNPDGTLAKRGFDHLHGDYSAVRIAQVFDTPGFDFSVSYLVDLHRIVFSGIYKEAGAYRTGAVTGNRTGKWSNHEWMKVSGDIPASLARLFAGKRDFFQKETFEGNIGDASKTLASFTVELWQTHPFPFANTRTIVLFLVKYLQSKGYAEGTRPLWEQATHLRESLIMANPEARAPGVEVITRPLERMFEIILETPCKRETF